jgi:glycosyltransferase involved in cell wall biosynthesis
VWVLTRKKNRRPIEAALAKEPLPNARFIYLDLPRWVRFWKKGRRGLHLYYYLWQLHAYFIGRKLHSRIGFDLAHHVTFVTFWMPSFLALLPPPFVWGPVGGGESAPRNFWYSFSLKGKFYELLRGVARTLCQIDPFVRLTARKAGWALATTGQTEKRLLDIGCQRTSILPAIGLAEDEIQWLGGLQRGTDRPFRLVSIGDLLHWKGFELGLRAFASLAGHAQPMEYWLIGDGPERKRLEKLVRLMRIEDRVIFWGELPRREALEKLAQCDALVHPSLHDSGACVVLEAMAAGCPVICLDLGGPAVHVNEQTGIKIAAVSTEQVLCELAAAIRRLAEEPATLKRLAHTARMRAREEFSWEVKGERLMEIYSCAANSDFSRSYVAVGRSTI